MVKRIGILTSGGDSPGMNAAIRAVTRVGLNSGLEVFGIYNGYKGMVEGYIEPLTRETVGDIVNRGGTILGSARLPEFKDIKVRKKAIAQLKKRGIEAVVVIGGDGSYRGALSLTEMGINCIGLPGTIDNDITCTDYTIGFQTALETVVECVDKLRDTSNSHHRCSIVEVMGRDAGYLALWCGIANGAERILLPEEEGYDIEDIIDDIKESKKRGKKNYIIINAEGVGDSVNLAKTIEERTGMETRATILGHMQRGGSPTCKDRVYASIMGSMAVDLLLEGKTNRIVGYRHGEYVDFDIEEALGMQKGIPAYQYEISKKLSL